MLTADLWIFDSHDLKMKTKATSGHVFSGDCKLAAASVSQMKLLPYLTDLNCLFCVILFMCGMMI